MKFDADDHKAFFSDIAEDGYHIFSRHNADGTGFYPNVFPAFSMLRMTDMKEGDSIRIRAFFSIDTAALPKIDSGYIDLEVEFVDQEAETVFGNIVTELPAEFALSKDTTIELKLDEILCVLDRQ